MEQNFMVWVFHESGKLFITPEDTLPANSVYLTHANRGTANLNRKSAADEIKSLESLKQLKWMKQRS
eukprot:10688799-Ditylum_brightwellii.AAC.1